MTKFSELPLHFSLNLASEFDGSCDEERAGIARVFGLSEQIGGDPASVTAPSQDDGFSGAGGKVDGAVGRNELLCSRYETVARAEDFFYARNGFCAVGESGNRLRAANPRNPADAQKIGHGEQLIGGVRANDLDARNACHLRGNGGHQQRGDKSKMAAGNVATDGFDRGDTLASFYAWLDLEGPGLRQLFFGDAAN